MVRKRRLQWDGHICRRDKKEDMRRVRNIGVEGKRNEEGLNIGE